jgi:hypothetical protein
MDLIDWGWLSPSAWFADATEPIEHPLYVVLAVVLTLAMVAALYVRLMAHGMFGGHRFKQRQAIRLAYLVVWLAAIGLIVLLFRWQPVPLLSKRVWLLLWWLAVLASAGYGVYFYRRLYPGRLAAFENNERRRRYLPRATTRRARRRR